MSANIDLAYLANTNDKYTLLRDVMYKEGKVYDGSILPQNGNVTDGFYNFQKFFFRPSSTLSKIVKNRYHKIFTEDIIRVYDCNNNVDVQYFEALDNNVDNSGNNRDEFMKIAGESATLYDICFIAMDDVAEKSISMVDQIENREFPFFTKYDPWQVDKNYLSFDSNGNLTQIAFDYKIVFDGDEVEKKKVFDTEYIYIISDEKEEVKVPHGLGEIPVYMLVNNVSLAKNKILNTTPSLTSVARASVILDSMDAFKNSSLANNCISTLFYKCSSQNEVQDYQENGFPLTGNNVVLYTADEQPQFGAPPSGNAPDIETNKENTLKTIYVEEGQYYATSPVSSGASKNEDKEENNNALSFFAKNLRDCEIWMNYIFNKKMELSLVESNPEYKVKYGLGSVSEQLNELAIVLGLDIDQFEFFNKAIYKKIAMTQFKGDDLDKILTEIDEGIITPDIDLNIEDGGQTTV